MKSHPPAGRPRRSRPHGLREHRYARTGVDEEFGKGTHLFGHQDGDPEHRPNVNPGPVDRAPFYAVAVAVAAVPMPLATSLGLRTDPEARVLYEHRGPLPAPTPAARTRTR
ncbi:hypothetical protein [Streptomyces sp. NPDC053728]|uniref:hypothetical protein n=1 Tax=Streptomyces sp. NPDC053728 TaxID=3155534 RepID=UPI00342E342B